MADAEVILADLRALLQRERSGGSPVAAADVAAVLHRHGGGQGSGDPVMDAVERAARILFAEDDFWRAWLETPRLDLDRRSPRQAVEAGDGERVLDLLRLFGV